MANKLTDKNERFCIEYVIDFNKTQAAIRAGYSEKTAQQIGSTLLLKVVVQERIKELQQVSIEKLDITHTDVLTQLKNWAYSDITETIELSAKEIKELPLEVRQLITKYKRTTKTFEGNTEEIIELHFVSKEKAIEMIAKHIGFFEVDNAQKKAEVTVDLGSLSTEELLKRAGAIGGLKSE